MKRTQQHISIVTLLLVLLTPFALCQDVDRTKPPQVGPPPLLRLPPIQRFTLSNGLPVVLVEKHDVPLVQINLVVGVGGAMDPPGKSGLASMTAAMMREGAGTRDALQLADAIDYLGARISSTAGGHTTGISLHTPLGKLDSALVLMADVAMRPTFQSAELERKRKERLTEIMQWHDQPRAIASVFFNQILYGTNHPYGIPTIGTEASLRSFRPEDLRQFHAAYFGANNASLIIVGDVTAASIRSRLQAVFGGWKKVSPPTVSLPPIEQVKAREVTIINKPGAPQSEIRIGRIGVPRLTDDYYALVVMNTILGGSFASRLNNNLREVHNYTYGAYSYFVFRPLAGPFLAGSAVQTAVTDSAVTEFMKELNGIREPVPDAELDRAKNYIALSFPGEFQSVAQIATKLEELVVYGLPDDYFDKYVTCILVVSRDDVQRVAKKYVDPETVAVILVGDQKEIEAGIRRLNLGPLRLMSIEDVLGKVPILEQK